MSDLINSINLVLNFCRDNNTKKLKCSSMPAKLATQQLQVILKRVQTLLNLDIKKYDINISYGSGYFPKVPWVGITPKGKKVSNSISTCICFSRTGEGIVCGAMFPEIKKKGQFVTVNRNLNGESYISLLGGAARTIYTNKFVNPVDFYINKINENDLMSQLSVSLKILDDYVRSNN